MLIFMPVLQLFCYLKVLLLYKYADNEYFF